MPKPNESAPAGARRHIDVATLDSMQEFIDGQRRAEQHEDEGGSAIHVHVHAAGVATADKKTADDADPPDLDKRFGAIEASMGTLGTKLSTLGAAVDSYFTANKKTADVEETAEEKAARLAKEKATKDAEELAMTGDSVALATSWQDLQSKAEILVPGFKMPTFDSAQPRKLTVDSMCKVRGRVLDLMAATAEGAQVISTLTGDAATDIEGMDCQAKALLFSSAAAYKAKANNAAATHDAGHPGALQVSAGPRNVSNAELSARNKKFWDELNAKRSPSKA